ncbi:MAG: hypothetical protein K2N87_00020 [Eubacterium sp.]|nr:hypothetical protein [Eubacterium sp.]
MMLEAGYRNLFEEAGQRGYEIGVSNVLLDMLAESIGFVKIAMSDERWERYKRSQEIKIRKEMSEGKLQDICYEYICDENRHIIKEKWLDEKQIEMKCMGFPMEGWEDIRAFVEKYPELPPCKLAERIVRESEYKYI